MTTIIVDGKPVAVVPVEPTEAMKGAGLGESPTFGFNDPEEVSTCWSAMLAVSDPALDAALVEMARALKPFAALAQDYLADTVNMEDDVIIAGRMSRRGEEGAPPRVLFADFRRALMALARIQVQEDTADDR